MSTVEERIETIMFVFRETQSRGWDEQVGIDEFSHPEFHSVAVEAMSELIASEEIAKGKTDLLQWKAFFHHYQNRFEAQLYTGLGWTLAKNGQSPSIFKAPSSFAESKILDGYGYYYGLFRSRLVVRSQQFPEEISNENLALFDAGIGRALWYQCKGELEKLAALVDLFSTERKPSLWQGIGLAACFVGGLNNEQIASLLLLSGAYSSSLKLGISAAIQSREKSGIHTDSEKLFSAIL